MSRPDLQLSKRRLSAIAFFLLAYAIPVATAAGANEATPRAAEVSVYLDRPKDPVHHVLHLQLYPIQGVAVVTTQVDLYTEPRGIVYAIRVPREPFEGSLDLTFPGLGRIDGTIDAHLDSEDCAGGDPTGASGAFTGTVRFRGAGDDERWAASEAKASVVPTCAPLEVPQGKGAVLLFDAVARRGPGFDGPVRVAFFARSSSERRALEFVAVASNEREDATFLAVDREWLPGRVAIERWVKRSTAATRRKLMVEPADGAPTRVALNPPSPFFGEATYSTRTRRLTGSLGARFPGLTLRLTRPPLRGTLYDEERPGRSEPTTTTKRGARDDRRLGPAGSMSLGFENRLPS